MFFTSQHFMVPDKCMLHTLLSCDGEDRSGSGNLSELVYLS
jgi:hypothetical protein